MSMKSLAIKDFAEVITGGTPSTSIAEYWNGDIPWLNSGELNKGIIFNASNFITKKGLSKSNAKLMPIDTVLIALTGTTTGATALLKIEACANQSVTGILPSVSHVPKYLYFYLRSIRKEIMDKSYGGAQKHISQQFVKDIQVPLPSIEEQHRIVKILDQAQSLIEKRKQAISYLDDYIKAVFLDMFGDPMSNPKGWEVKKLGDLVSEFRYGTNTISDTKKTDLKLPILRIPNIIGEKINYHDLKYSTVDDKEKEKIKLIEGDLLFVRSNGNPAYIGRCAVFEDHFECGYASYLIRARLKNDENCVSSQLIRDVISFPTYRHLVLEKAKTTAGNYNINIESLKSLNIIVPPLKLQDSFISISKRTESLKQKMQTQLQELEDNFQVHLQRVFRGK